MLKNEILGHYSKSNEKDFNVEGWPKDKGLKIRKLTGSEVEKYGKYIMDIGDDVSWLKRAAFWIVLCLYNKDGNRVFSPETEEDADRLLQEVPYASIQDAASEIMEFNGVLSKVEDSTAVDEAKKNS